MFGLVLNENWRWVVRGLLLFLGIFWTVGSLVESGNQPVGTTIALLVVGIALILLYFALRSRNWGGWARE